MKWKEFKLEDLFNITGSKTTSKEALEKMGDGKYPYVTTQTTNNGQAGYFAKYTETGNILVVDSAVAGFCTYQKNNFTASDHVEKLKPKGKFNKYIAMFFVLQINKNNFAKFSYGYKASQSRLKGSKILLPVDSAGNPDYEYMERYIKDLEKKKENDYIAYISKELGGLKYKEIPALNEKKWKAFRIDEIYTDLHIAKAIDYGKTKQGNNTFIGRGSTNNGIQGFVNNEIVEKGNCITIGMVGGLKAFYQTSGFVTSQNILIHRSEKINKYNAIFISAIINNSVLNKYSYGRPLKISVYPKEKIMLPVNNLGEPDYEYMEQYIKNMEYNKIIDYLGHIA